MSMEINFDFSEIVNLSSVFTAAGQNAQRSAEQVVAKSAHDLESAAKAAAPVDTGALMGSISSDISGLHAEIGPTMNYSAYVEFGTYKMSPQPYMGPATDRVEPSFIAAMEQIVGDIL